MCENKKTSWLLTPYLWHQATKDCEASTDTLCLLELSLAETFPHDAVFSYTLQLWRKEVSYWWNSYPPIPPGVSHLAEDFILFKTRDHCSHPGLASSNPRIICVSTASSGMLPRSCLVLLFFSLCSFFLPWSFKLIAPSLSSVFKCLKEQFDGLREPSSGTALSLLNSYHSLTSASHKFGIQFGTGYFSFPYVH